MYSPFKRVNNFPKSHLQQSPTKRVSFHEWIATSRVTGIWLQPMLNGQQLHNQKIDQVGRHRAHFSHCSNSLTTREIFKIYYLRKLHKVSESPTSGALEIFKLLHNSERDPTLQNNRRISTSDVFFNDIRLFPSFILNIFGLSYGYNLN